MEVRCQHERVHEPKRRLELEDVAHLGVLTEGLEEVVVYELPKRAANQLVAKHSRTVVRADSYREPAAAPEMPSLPGDLVAGPEHTRAWASNDTLAGVSCRLQMHVDAQREVEAPLAGRTDQRHELNPAHWR
jgi:hypothetical protein